MIKSGNNYIFKFYNTKKMKNFSFKNVMYAIGTSLFLIMLIFTLSNSLINPMYGMSEGIMFKSLTSTSSGDCDDECDRANPNDECYVRDAEGNILKKCIGWKPKSKTY